MRLICPNCGAQYEVPDEVIPENGRDVQCSNCGDTWFQTHPDHPQISEDAPETEFDDADQPDWAELPEEAPEPQPEPQPEPRPAPEEPARRSLDPDVASVLREEASRERQARQADARGGLESQPDLGLESAGDGGDKRSDQARTRMDRLKGATTPREEPADEVEVDPGSRSGLLPDINEVNSSIATTAENEEQDRSARDGTRTAASPDTAGSFGRGMRMAVALAVIGTAIYMFAPQIAGMVPATAGPLSAYVEFVNQGRVMVNEQIGVIVAQVQALAGG